MVLDRNVKLKFALFFGFILFLYVLRSIFHPWIIGSDGLSYYAPLRSLAIDGDLHLANEFRDYNPFGHQVYDPTSRTPTGHVPNKYPIGCALLWSPFFLLAHWITLIANASGSHLSPDGYSRIYELMIGFGTLFYGCLGLLFLRKLCKLYFSEMITDLAIIVFVLASNLIYYLVAEPSMPHAISMFSVVLFSYVWVKDYGRKTMFSYVKLGLLSGLMIMVRYQNGFFMLLPLLEIIDTTFSHRLNYRRVLFTWVSGCIYLAAVFLALIPQFVVWKIIYGGFFVYSYAGEGFDFLSPKLLQVLFSSRHGLISWTPIIFFSIWGLLLFLRKEKRVGLFIFICLLMQLYVNASWNCWWFANAYGARAFINCTFIFVLGLCTFFDFAQRKGRFLTILGGSALIIVWNLLFIVQFSLKLISHTESISWSVMARNQVGVIILIFNKLVLVFNS